MSSKFFINECMKLVQKEVGKRLAKAAQHLHEETRNTISIRPTGYTTFRGKTVPVRATPGAPIRRVTGNTYRALQWEVLDWNHCVVGLDPDYFRQFGYAKYWEYRLRSPQHQWFLRTVRKQLPDLQQIITKG